MNIGKLNLNATNKYKHYTSFHGRPQNGQVENKSVTVWLLNDQSGGIRPIIYVHVYIGLIYT